MEPSIPSGVPKPRKFEVGLHMFRIEHLSSRVPVKIMVSQNLPEMDTLEWKVKIKSSKKYKHFDNPRQKSNGFKLFLVENFP